MAVLMAVMVLAASPAAAQDAADFFRANCTACHTIGGGRLIGPDLKDVARRQERAWLERFIQNPQAVIDAGDPYALKLLSEGKGVVMTRISGITPEVAKRLMDMIEAESALEKSQFMGTLVSDRPLGPEDVARGLRLFLGEERQIARGPACISCHSVSGAGWLGGGRLGPDLTAVYTRLGGRKALAAWIASPPGPTMAPIFQKTPLDGEEVLALVAILRDTAAASRATKVPDPGRFLTLGLGGLVLALVLMDVIWRGRYQATREPLVRGDR